MGKMLKLILGTMMLCVAIGPFLQGVPKMNLSSLQDSAASNTSSFSALVQQQKTDAAKKQIQEMAEVRLQQSGIAFRKVEVQLLSGTAEGSHTAKVTVTLPDSSNQARAESLLRESLGMEVEVKTVE
jgi:hypothetical protein